jgi:hypothetical protein
MVNATERMVNTMSYYRRQKTTTGHRYYCRMPGSEIAERILFRIAVVAVPFLGAAGMFLLWVKMW